MEYNWRYGTYRHMVTLNDYGPPWTEVSNTRGVTSASPVRNPPPHHPKVGQTFGWWGGGLGEGLGMGLRYPHSLSEIIPSIIYILCGNRIVLMRLLCWALRFKTRHRPNVSVICKYVFILGFWVFLYIMNMFLQK